MEYLFNLFFPSKCNFCNKYGKVICANCLKEAKVIMETHCLICERPTLLGKTHFKCSNNATPNQILHIFEYSGLTRQVIKRSKYGNKEFSLLKCLTLYGIELAEFLGYTIPRNYLVVPIPVSKEKLAKRGFNQAEIIAKLVAKQFNLKVNSNVLTRIKNSKPQYSNNRIERFANVKNVFEVKNKNYIKKRRILLVDDISTSGATLLEASKALYTAEILELDSFILSKKHL